MKTLLGRSGLVVLPREKKAPDVLYVAFPISEVESEPKLHLVDHNVTLFVRLEAFSPELQAQIVKELEDVH